MILTGVLNAISSNPVVGVTLIQHRLFLQNSKLGNAAILGSACAYRHPNCDVNPCAVRRVYEEALEVIFSFRRIGF